MYFMSVRNVFFSEVRIQLIVNVRRLGGNTSTDSETSVQIDEFPGESETFELHPKFISRRDKRYPD